jgi:3-dehydroquinate dehydratase-2
MKIAIINGPNLNMLGKRDARQYGTATLDEIQTELKGQFPDHSFTSFQSNVEGELVDFIQSLIDTDHNGLVANFGGYTHTSVAIRDALELLTIPVVEVHLSNIHAREPFREESITGSQADGIITGFGRQSYFLGITALENMLK